MRQHLANILDIRDGFGEVECGQVELVPCNPFVLSQNLGNLRGPSTSHRGDAGVSQLLPVAAREFLSPAKSAVRKPCFFAGAMSRVRFEPTTTSVCVGVIRRGGERRQRRFEHRLARLLRFDLRGDRPQVRGDHRVHVEVGILLAASLCESEPA